MNLKCNSKPKNILGKLRYLHDVERYGVFGNFDCVKYGLHNEEELYVFINRTWQKDNICFSNGDWCLKNSGLKGNELEGLMIRYKVS